MSEENQDNPVGQTASEYMNPGGFDISMPDIPIPEPEEEQVAEKEIKDEVETAFKFAFIGAGQGGSRIAETFYDFGYRKVAVLNTAQQDLNTIKKVPHKLCIGEGGAGKDPSFA